ncbi:MAG TPA: YggT family protein [Bacillota bacterium]|nr:YggT family protein [Bacillota bacterium]HPJ85685.1 YggT family protein [Bacillota bacterium]HPQ61678.1 YggT family protein [Bacillota bacterium]
MPEILYYILTILYSILQVYFVVMIVTIILSWTSVRNTRTYQVLDRISSLYLGYFRNWLTIGMFDFTPMIGLIVYQIILGIIARVL